LQCYLHAEALTEPGDALLQFAERQVILVDGDEHGHGEDMTQDGLTDVLDIRARLRQDTRDCGDDTHPVLSQDRQHSRGSHTPPPGSSIQLIRYQRRAVLWDVRQ
jgi:hypothetical protein